MSKALGTVLIIAGIFCLLFINILLGIPLIIAGIYLVRKTPRPPPAYPPPQAPYGFYYPQPAPPPPPPPPAQTQYQPAVAQRYVCPNCGQLLSGRGSFCPSCGVRLA